MVFKQGARITPFIRSLSTTTIIESKPEERGRSVIRSTESCLKGRETEDNIGQSGGIVGYVLTLLCWQTAQPVMKCLTKVERPGHQKLCSKINLVWKTPMCPKREEEWMEWSRMEHAEGGTYM